MAIKITELYQGRAGCSFNEKNHTYHFRVPGVVEKLHQPSVTGLLGMKAKPALITWAAKESLKVIRRKLAERQSRLGESCSLDANILETWLAEAEANWRDEDGSTTIGHVAHSFAYEELRSRHGLAPKPRFPIELDPVLMPDFTPAMLEATNASASQIVKFFDEHDFKPIMMERPLWSPTEGYCGTPDYIGLYDGVLTVADYKTSKKIYAEYWAQLAALQNMYEEEFPDQKIMKRVAINIPKDGSDLQVQVRDRDHRQDEDLGMFRACQALYNWNRANDDYAAGEPIRVLGNIFQQQAIVNAQLASEFDEAVRAAYPEYELPAPAQRQSEPSDRPW